MSLRWLKRGDAADRNENQLADVAHPLETPPLGPGALDEEIRRIEMELNSGLLDEAEVRLEAVRKSNPTDSRVLMNVGAWHFLREDHSAAVASLVSAIKAEPASVRAHYLLSASLSAQGDHATALEVAKKILQQNPRDVDLHLVAANACIQMGDYESGARLLNNAISIQPDATAPHYRLEGLSQHSTWRRSNYEYSPKVATSRRRVVNRLLAAHRRKGLDAESLTALLCMLESSRETFALALKIANSVPIQKSMATTLADQVATIFWAAGDAKNLVKLRELCFDADPQNPYFKLALSHAWLISGTENWSESWRIMTTMLQQIRPKAHPDQVPLWEGQRLGKRKVMVYQDQGIGDAIMAFRFIPMLRSRGIRFDLWVFPKIFDLAVQLQGYENLIRKSTLPDPRAHGCEFAVPLFGLIAALNLEPGDLENPPVVLAGADKAIDERKGIAAIPHLRIGLVYGGNPNRRDDWERSVPIQSLSLLANIKGISWVNLMVDERPDRGEAIKMLNMHDPSETLLDFSYTAAVVEELDAVVAVDSSVAHVAGCVGKPVWVLAPSSCDWRWQIGERESPWWPTARLLRSDFPGVWEKTMKTLTKELVEFVTRKASTPPSQVIAR